MGDQMRLLVSLQSLRGAEFEREHARQQVLPHASVLPARGYADQGFALESATATPVIGRNLRIT